MTVAKVALLSMKVKTIETFDNLKSVAGLAGCVIEPCTEKFVERLRRDYKLEGPAYHPIG